MGKEHTMRSQLVDAQIVSSQQSSSENDLQQARGLLLVLCESAEETFELKSA